jgi:hypothetical protein
MGLQVRLRPAPAPRTEVRKPEASLQPRTAAAPDLATVVTGVTEIALVTYASRAFLDARKLPK